MSRRGRPSNADLAERERLKAEAAAHDRFRKKMEAKIARGRVKIIEWDDAVVRTLMGETLPDDCLVAAPPSSPAMQFLLDRVRGTLTDEQFDAAIWQAMIDLHLSDDIPRDKDVDHLIAVEMRKRTDPEFAQRCRDRAKFAAVTGVLALGERRGQTKQETLKAIAEEFGHVNGEALRQWMMKHGDD